LLKRSILILFAVIVVFIAWELLTFPDVEALAKEPPKTTAFMERRKAELRRAGKDPTIRYTWVPYGRISPSLRRAVLVAEDNEFYEHKGVDTEAMKEAFERNWKRGRITHGGSTITQQLAKNLYLSPSRNPLRKVREYFIARSLEKNLTKKRILEIYLNVVEMGERVYGAEAASRFYFRKPASQLNASQAALLAGCLPNPRLMNPGSPNKRLRARQRMILSRMRRWGYQFEREVLTERKPAARTETTAPAPPATDTDLAPPTDTEISPQETDTSATIEPKSTETTGTTATTETTSPQSTDTSTTTSTTPPPGGV
jgi:monofunctional glycosyltransferase